MNRLKTKLALLAGLGALAMLPSARADQWNQKTVFTFSGPVEIPGQTLPAGTYVFKLHNSNANRHIVQVFNQEENQIFGTFLAIPDYRLRPSDKPIITFHERPSGSPDAIRAWFYPGRNYGHEFVYPKSKAVDLAKANHVPVPSMPVELTPDTIQPSTSMNGPEVAALVAAPLKAEEPSGQEVEIAQAFATEAALPERLPSTATGLPLAGLIGMLSLGTAVTLRLASAKSK